MNTLRAVETSRLLGTCPLSAQLRRNQSKQVLPIGSRSKVNGSRSLALNALAHKRAEDPQFPAQKRLSTRRPVAESSVASEEASSFGRLIAEFSTLETSQERLKLLIKYGKKLEGLTEDQQILDNRVMGCATQVWITAEVSDDGSVVFKGDSDSDISRGICSVLFECVAGLTAEEVIEMSSDDISSLGSTLGVALASTPSRSSAVYNVVEAMRTRARLLTEAGSGCSSVFPSLTITSEGISAQGAFAKTQAEYLEPNPEAVDRLAKVLSEKKIGIVAHFYMDPQVQGVLTAAKKQWKHVDISDSLVMADRAVAMCEVGCEQVIVLGVDFMTENVRAVMDGAGYPHIPVYRLAAEDIGCSLAEAAQAPPYFEYLNQAQELQEPSVHIIYINTSLYTKAKAHDLVPTITCTSSNVVATVLQAAAQVPGVNIWYGPDSYMGGNLAELFQRLTQLTDEDVKQIHPDHTVQSIKDLLPRLRYFQEGICVVHHIFGGDVCNAVRAGYSDAYMTAHFEVPGEMFKLAMEAKEREMGTVGSTKNILDFITARCEEALARGAESNQPERLRFVLGTEAGMITSIVTKVKEMLAGQPLVEVEVVFPVSSSAITTSENSSVPTLPDTGGIIPGPAGGEGCSAEGGCASCPYMKMNSLDALFRVCDYIGTSEGVGALPAFEPKKYDDTNDVGATLAERGVLPITHMRYYTKNGKFSDDLVNDIVSRS